jgi:hypothetical protein
MPRESKTSCKPGMRSGLPQASRPRWRLRRSAKSRQSSTRSRLRLLANRGSKPLPAAVPWRHRGHLRLSECIVCESRGQKSHHA